MHYADDDIGAEQPGRGVRGAPGQGERQGSGEKERDVLKVVAPDRGAARHERRLAFDHGDPHQTGVFGDEEGSGPEPRDDLNRAEERRLEQQGGQSENEGGKSGIGGHGDIL